MTATKWKHADVDYARAADFVFHEFEQCAVQGKPVRSNELIQKDLKARGLPVAQKAGSHSGHLAATGRIQIFISGKNHRQVQIETGDHAGKRSAPNPAGSQPHLLISCRGTTRL